MGRTTPPDRNVQNRARCFMTFKIIAPISRFLLLRDSYTAVFSSVIPLTALTQSRHQKRPPHWCESLDNACFTCYIMCKWCTVKLLRWCRLFTSMWWATKWTAIHSVDRACFIVWNKDTIIRAICLVRCINHNSHTTAIEWILTAFQSLTHMIIPSFQHNAL